MCMSTYWGDRSVIFTVYCPRTAAIDVDNKKTKCSGVLPCEQCSKKSLACISKDKDRKILVSRESGLPFCASKDSPNRLYRSINNLQQRIEAIGQQPRNENRVQFPDTADNDRITLIEFGVGTQHSSYHALIDSRTRGWLSSWQPRCCGWYRWWITCSFTKGGLRTKPWPYHSGA